MAYLNASTQVSTPSYVMLPMLPPDDPEHRDRCGVLNQHMCGTRAAADGWQQEYADFTRALAFRQVAASPRVFINVEKELVVSVHGDDFTSTGPKCTLDCFKDKLEAKHELKKAGQLGPASATQRNSPSRTGSFA